MSSWRAASVLQPCDNAVRTILNGRHQTINLRMSFLKSMHLIRGFPLWHYALSAHMHILRIYLFYYRTPTQTWLVHELAASIHKYDGKMISQLSLCPSTISDVITVELHSSWVCCNCWIIYISTYFLKWLTYIYI